jgi:integrase
MKSKIQNVTFSTYKVGKKFYVTIYNSKGLNGQPLKINRNTQETSERPAKIRAEEIISELFGGENEASTGAQADNNTISAMMDKYHENFLENIKIHSLEKQKKDASDIMSRLGHIKRHMGGEHVKNLSLNRINEYIKSRRADVKANGAHYSDGTIKHEIGVLKTAANVLPNGLKGTVKMNMTGKHTPLGKPDERDKIPDEDFDLLLQKFQEYDLENKQISNWGFFVEMLMFTSVRWGQMQLLEYNDIFKIKDKYLRFAPGKCKHLKPGDKPHKVMVNAKILRKLKKFRESSDFDPKYQCECPKSKTCKIRKSNFVFPNKHKRCEHFSKDMFYFLWNGFCEDLGFTDFDEFKKSGKRSRYLPHDIRKTRIVKLIQQGIDRSYIMQQSGHQSQEIFNRYNKVQDVTMEKIIESQNERDAAMQELNKKIKDKLDADIEAEDRQYQWDSGE